MGRITTNNPKSNYETLNNYCTVGKDGWVLLNYAGGKEKINLHEYTAECCKKHGCKNITKDVVAESGLLDCYDCPIAIMYYCGMQAASNNVKLAAYEDSELSPSEVMKMIENSGKSVYTMKTEIKEKADAYDRIAAENKKLRELLRMAVNELEEKMSDLCETTEIDSVYSPCYICVNQKKCKGDVVSGLEWIHTREVMEVLKE